MYIQIWRKQNWFYSSDDRRKYYIEFVIVPKCGISNFFYQQFFNLFIWVCFWSTISFSKHNLCNKPDWCPEKKNLGTDTQKIPKIFGLSDFLDFLFFLKIFCTNATWQLVPVSCNLQYFDILCTLYVFMKPWKKNKASELWKSWTFNSVVLTSFGMLSFGH